VPDDDVAFDEALAHISFLAGRLHQIRALHRPQPTLLGGRRCADCGRRYPCPTVTCISGSTDQRQYEVCAP
jgi:hypothetical protein